MGRGQCGLARGQTGLRGNAGQGQRGGNGPCVAGAVRIEGAIASLDASAQQIVVGDVTVQVTDSTLIRQQRQVISFADLSVGETVAACGVMGSDVLVANRVTVRWCGR